MDFSCKLTRIQVVLDGRIKASFSDGGLLLLTANAKSYVHVASDGTQQRHWIEYALHSKQLREVLRFRNLYFPDSVHSTRVLGQEQQRREILLPSGWSPSWPQTKEDAEQLGLITEREEYVFVYSEDRQARVVYDSIGQRCSLRSPRKISVLEQEWIVEDKVVMNGYCPKEWRHPVQLALSMRGECLVDSGESFVVRGESLELWMPRSGSWWLRETPLLPKEEVVVLEWTPEATFLYQSNEEECCAWVQEDDSYFRTKQKAKYIQHSCRFPKRDRLYSMTTFSPSHVIPRPAAHVNALPWLLERCLAIRYTLPTHSDTSAALCRSHGCLYSKSVKHSIPSQRTELSSKVKEEVETTKGFFTAYKDGRIRVRFVDRTLLYINCCCQEGRLILANGETVALACVQPDEYKEYVWPALQFSEWTQCSELEREALLLQWSAVEDACFHSQRLSTLGLWAVSRKTRLIPHTSANISLDHQ